MTAILSELAVHDRPCGECRHHSRVIGRSICVKKLMAVTPDMFVSYYIEPDELRGRPGLCFEAALVE